MTCGVKGDAFSFLVNFLNIEYTEAVKLLAKKFKVTLTTIKKKNNFTNKGLCKTIGYDNTRLHQIHWLIQNKNLTQEELFVLSSEYCKIKQEKRLLKSLKS
jgi:uncharacterized protein YfkK (UPF0435 family)